MLWEPKWHKQWQRPYGTSSLFIMVFPKKILTDQGCNFESQLVADLCELMGVQKNRPVCIIHRPMVNVKDSTPLWLICLGHYPRKRSQSGKIKLGHWSMHITALEIQPQGSAPTISCLVDNLTFQLMWHLVGSMHHHGVKHNKIGPKVKRMD